MRGRTLVLSSLLAVAMGSWGCKVSVNEGDLDNRSDEGRDAGRRDAGGTAGKPPKPPKAGSGATADGGVAGSGSKAGRGGTGSGTAGTSGGAGTGSSDPVPGNTKLMDLDAADATALCEQLTEEIGEIITDEDASKVLCTLDALIFSTDPNTGELDVAACEEEVDTCLEQGLGEGATECGAEDLSSVTTCEATVTEYVDCYRGIAEQMADFVEQFTCTTLVDLEAMEEAFLAIDTDKIPACVMLFDKCPELEEG